MRKITKNVVSCFLAEIETNEGNTSVSIEFDSSVGRVVFLKLHGNKIARKLLGSKVIEISNAGWFSNTTKERLNALPGARIQQVNGQWYQNGKLWDGQWITIN